MTTNLLVLIGGAGVFQSLFLSFYVLTSALRNRFSNLVLLILNLCILIFLVNTLYLFIGQNGSKDISSLSLGAFAIVGPLTYFYVKVFIDARYKLSYKYLAHLLPGFIPILVSAGFLRIPIGYIGGYVFFYLIISLIKINGSPLSGGRKFWMYSLFGGIMAMVALTVFFSIGILCIISISIGFTIVTYLISYLAIRFSRDLFSAIPDPSAKNLTTAMPDAADLFQSICLQMTIKKFYKDPGLTLPKLATQVNVHTHKLSYLVNSQAKINLQEFINSFRIKEAKRILVETDMKVAAVAFECGFNSLSTFYAVFKKETGISPTDFRVKNKLSIVRL